jgi:hypothetical protein
MVSLHNLRPQKNKFSLPILYSFFCPSSLNMHTNSSQDLSYIWQFCYPIEKKNKKIEQFVVRSSCSCRSLAASSTLCWYHSPDCSGASPGSSGPRDTPPAFHRKLPAQSRALLCCELKNQPSLREVHGPRSCMPS